MWPGCASTPCLREANAFYNPQKKALMFGYFTATSQNPALT